MKTADLIGRINQLVDLGQQALGTAKGHPQNPTYRRVDDGVFREFRAASLSFLEHTFGQEHTYFKEFAKGVGGTEATCVSVGVHILQAARCEFEGGWAASLRGQISGEMLADFLSLAKRSLDESKDVAAVLVCASLEDAMKRLAVDKGLDVEDKEMAEVINALKGNGILKGPQASIAQSYVKLRNKAFHAEWSKIEKSDVSSAIGFAEQFLLQHFG